MNNKMKYVEEILILDVSMTTKFYDKLEELMSQYLHKKYIVTVSDIALVDPTIKELIEKCELFSFRDDKNFKEIDSGFVIISDNGDYIKQIKNIVNENSEYKMDSVMTAIALADVENILNNG